MNGRSIRQAGGARKGFTLLELIVVITIIGILGTLVVVKVQGWVEKARIEKIKSDLREIYKAAEIYQVVTGSFPNSIEELRTGKDPQGNDIGATIGDAKDPWNVEYVYELGSEGKPRIRCLGKDGVEGGEGINKDYAYPESSNP